MVKDPSLKKKSKLNLKPTFESTPNKYSVIFYTNDADMKLVNTITKKLENAGFIVGIFEGEGIPGYANTVGHYWDQPNMLKAAEVAYILDEVDAGVTGFCYPNMGYEYIFPGTLVLNLIKQAVK